MKKKKAVKYTGEVGHIVKVTWIDSGNNYYRYGVAPSNCRLDICVTYGRIVYEDRGRVVVALHHHQDAGDSPINDMYQAIWRPSIQKIRRLR